MRLVNQGAYLWERIASGAEKNFFENVTVLSRDKLRMLITLAIHDRYTSTIFSIRKHDRRWISWAPTASEAACQREGNA